MYRPNPFVVALVAGTIGALASLGVTAVSEGSTGSQKDGVKDCVYAVVKASPKPARELPECKSLDPGDYSRAEISLTDFLVKLA